MLVAKKDFNAPKHEELDIPNLEVIKALQSLTSKGFVKTRFSWQWYYYVLTPEGVEYLREWYVSCILTDDPGSDELFLPPPLPSLSHSGSTFPTRSSRRRTRRRCVHRVRHRRAPAAVTVRTARRAVVTGTTTARRRTRPATTGHRSRASAVVRPGSRILLVSASSV